MTEERGEGTGRSVALILEYDGARYGGFQRQTNAPTIQAELESAIERLTGERVSIVAAGRTDAGVHARGQVVGFTTQSRLPVAEMQRALNALLPLDIAVREVRETTRDFHARFSAVRRTYRYTILNTAVRSPLLRGTSCHVATPLDVTAMHNAAQALVGQHDFAAFGGPMRKGGSTVRTVYRVTCQRQGELVIVEIEANAYLSRMVRHIVGTLLAVGRGAMAVDEVAAILAARDRRRAQNAAPPQGLCLMDIGY